MRINMKEKIKNRAQKKRKRRGVARGTKEEREEEEEENKKRNRRICEVELNEGNRGKDKVDESKRLEKRR